jgi:hypothetical protein
VFKVRSAPIDVSRRACTFVTCLVCCSVCAVVAMWSTPAQGYTFSTHTGQTALLASPPGEPIAPAIPNPVIWNRLLVPPPTSSLAADVVDAGRVQETPGRGISTQSTDLGSGITLAPTATACNDFNQAGKWHEAMAGGAVNWYAGWAPFAVNQGLYRSSSVVFAQERTVGPGRYSGADQYSAKIASPQPYAAGFGSPPISVTPGATVTVSMSYLLWDHDQHGLDYDWVSLGLKPDAFTGYAVYTNGFTRGRWAKLTNTVQAGPNGQIMVLIQASSPGALNSNVYFDNVEISVDGNYLTDCLAE